jgi:hypothetical protein
LRELQARLRGQSALNGPVISIATRLLRIANAFVALYAVRSGARFAIVMQSPEKFVGTMKYFPWPAFVALPFELR